MTFEDDFIRLRTDVGPRNFLLSTFGLDWPPPEKISIGGFPFVRVGISAITDEQRAQMTHVCRGAEYTPETAPQSDGGVAK